MKNVHLGPGDLVFSTEPVLIHSALGSCVALCVFDSNRRIGGAVHIVLPAPFENIEDTSASPGKYASTGVPALLQKFKLAGSNLQDLVVKILGGAKKIESKAEYAAFGAKNIEAVKELLKKYNLTITRAVVGGETGVTLKFNTYTGEIEFRAIGATHSSFLPPS